MKVTSAMTIRGKVLTFDDGLEVLVISGGMESHLALTFKKVGDEWVSMPFPEAMPYVVVAAKMALGMTNDY